MNKRPALFGFHNLGMIFVDIMWYWKLEPSSLISNFLF